jgi:hypothetical protein
MQLAFSNPQASEAAHAEVLHIQNTGETVIQLGHKDGNKIVASLHLAEDEAKHLWSALAAKFDGGMSTLFHGKRMVIAGPQQGSTIVEPSNTVPGSAAVMPGASDAKVERPSPTVENGLPQGELKARGDQTAPGSTDAAAASQSPASVATATDLDGTADQNLEKVEPVDTNAVKADNAGA